MFSYDDEEAPPLFCCDAFNKRGPGPPSICTGLLFLVSVRRLEESPSQLVTLRCERCNLVRRAATDNESFAYWLARRGSPESWPNRPPYFGPQPSGPET